MPKVPRLFTEAQRRYIQHYIATFLQAFEAKLEPDTEREIVIDMDTVAGTEEGERPAFYYAAESQQTRFTCEACGDFNDIRGIFGYCASCACRNNVQTLKASFIKMRDRLNDGHVTPTEIVRHSVSEFDACCRNLVSQLVKRIPMKPGRRANFDRLIFHDIEHATIGLLKSTFGVDVLRHLDTGDQRFVKRMLERRHVYEHNGGVADARYIRESKDTEWREGDLIRETQGNAHQLLNLLTRMATNVQEDFHEVFPLTEWPVNYHRER